MTTPLKQSTAATIVLGPFVDNTDGYTPETALTISQADIRLSKNGGAFAQTNNAAGATHMENGNYSVPLDATDTNTIGRLRVAVYESGALSVWRDFEVLDARAYARCVEGATFNERGGRVWYVAASGGSSSNDGTYSQPFDLFSTALAAASPGDEIVFKAGSYATTGTLDCTKMNIHIRGEGINTTGGTKITLTTATSFTKIINLSSGCTVSDMWLVCADKGIGVGASGRHNVTAERLRIDGHEDMVAFAQCHGVIVRDTRGTTDWDGITINGAGGEGAAIIENCSVVGDCSATEATAGYKGLYLTNCAARVRNCHVTLTQSAVSAENVYGILSSLSGPAVGGTLLEGCTFDCTVADGTGNAVGVQDNGQSFVQMFGGAIRVLNITPTKEFYVRLSNADSRAVLTAVTGVNDIAKLSGAVQLLDSDLSLAKTRVTTALPAVAPAANGGLPTVNASNQVAGVSGDVLGSVNSISGVTFPTNFGALAINASGHVSRVTLTDTATALTEEVSNVGSLHSTTIATLASQTSFTLTDGSPDNDAYNGCMAIVTDASTSTQKCRGRILDYVGSTKTVTLEFDPAIFTMAAGDSIAIVADISRAAAQFANEEIVESLTTKLSRRADGTTVGIKTILLREDEITPIWIDCSAITGGRWLDSISSAASSTPAALVVNEYGVHRHYAVVYLDSTSAVAGTTYTLTVNCVPKIGQLIKAKVSVKISSD